MGLVVGPFAQQSLDEAFGLAVGLDREVLQPRPGLRDHRQRAARMPPGSVTPDSSARRAARASGCRCPTPLKLGSSNGNRKVVYSGDTGWFDDLPDLASNSDLFICECTFSSPGFNFHLNHELLAERRELFDCGRMLLTHLGEEMTDRRGQCAIETADDGLIITI